MTAIITGAPATIAAIGAIIATAMSWRKTDIVQKKVEEGNVATSLVQAKVEAVDAKTIEIHTLTNSNLSKVTAALEVANTKIEGLEKLMGAMNTAKVIADKVIAKDKL